MLRRYQIIHQDGEKYLANLKGDILYTVTGIPNCMIAAACETGQYYDWHAHSITPPKTRGMRSEPTYNKGAWIREGDNVVDVMMAHPKRTYKEMLFMASLEGLQIVDGIAVKK